MDNSIRKLSDYAHELAYDDLPQQAIYECKRRLIDTLGCAIGAFDAEPSRIARAVAECHVGNPSARVFGTLKPSSPEQAAFANGAMLRYEDFNDSYYMKSSGHPSDTLAAVLAAADSVHANGKAVITATNVAYEAFCNFSDIMPPEQGWDYVIFGVVACALASGKLMGLDAEKMAQAVALAVTPNLALEQTRAGELSMWKGCAAGNAARNGIFAAQLAQHGLTGPDEAIEGRWGLQHALGRIAWAPFGGRGGPFRLTQTHLKYFPAVVHSQSPITAAIELHAQVKPEDIKAVVVDTYWVAKRYTDRASPLWHPGTRETADHSLPYIIAAALIDGTISAASFSDERLRDRRIADLLEKMSLREKPEYTRAHPSSWPCRIEITTHAGERKAASVEYFKGHAKNPMSDAEVETKFRDLTAPFMKPARVDAILAKLWMLEQLADIGEVIELLAVDPVR
ncbi:MAG TPA: MmgE/PrpD family protein [Burkholderiales bacterium]|nr:MmgE/PrpD family protein [Burkholderiales bacterium]